MTTPSGQISLNDVNVELGLAGTTLISMNQSNVRTLAGVGGSGTQISMQNLQGKSNRVSISYTFSSSAANASLNLSALGGYSAGKTDFTVTVNGGVYLYATSTGNYGLNLSGGTTGDTLTIVNNGYIMGMGGKGGGGYGGGNLAGSSGGPALNLGFGMSSCTINNTNASAYIGGGGGGGAGTVQYNGKTEERSAGGGGVGGGSGGSNNDSAGVGGAGGSIGGSGSNGTTYLGGTGGGGGGRVFPGVGASANPGGYANVGKGATGGGGGGGNSGGTGAGGAGGSSNSSGGNYGPSGRTGGGGGGWGASGGTGIYTYNMATYSGGSGGKAVNLNGKSVTWTSGNTTRVWGTVS